VHRSAVVPGVQRVRLRLGHHRRLRSGLQRDRTAGAHLRLSGLQQLRRVQLGMDGRVRPGLQRHHPDRARRSILRGVQLVWRLQRRVHRRVRQWLQRASSDGKDALFLGRQRLAGLQASASFTIFSLYSTVYVRRLAFSGTSVTSPRDVIAVAVMVGSLLALLSKLLGSSCLTHVGREGRSSALPASKRCSSAARSWRKPSTVPSSRLRRLEG
jgi:hypothetical protein